MNRALIIGINNYDQPEISDLRGANNDANAIYNLLKLDNSFKSVFVQKELKDSLNLLTDENVPSRTNILKQLHEICNLSEQNDLILFYFAGHGFRAEKDDYLIVKDTIVEALEDTGLPVNRITTIMEQSRASKKVLIFDACRNILENRNERDLDSTSFSTNNLFAIRNISSEVGWEILSSCAPGEVSIETNNDDSFHGLFTNCLIKNVHKFIAEIKDEITAEDLHQECVKYFKKHNNYQAPFYYCNRSQSAVLFKKEISQPKSKIVSKTTSFDHSPKHEKLIEDKEGKDNGIIANVVSFKQTDSRDLYDDKPSVHLIPFKSNQTRKDLEFLDNKYHLANNNFHLRAYLPSLKKGDKFNRVYFFFNGLAEAHPRIFDEIGWELAHKNIPSILIPLPGHFNRHPDFPIGSDDKFIIDNYDDIKFHTQRLLQSIYKHPHKIIVGFKQILTDTSNLYNLINDGKDPFWSQIFHPNINASIMGYSLGGLCALGLFMRDFEKYDNVILLESGANLEDVDAKHLFKRNGKVLDILWDRYLNKNGSQFTKINENIESLFSISESTSSTSNIKSKLEIFKEALQQANSASSSTLSKDTIDLQKRNFERHDLESRKMWEDIMIMIYKVLDTGEYEIQNGNNTPRQFSNPLDRDEMKIFRSIFLGDQSILHKRRLDEMAKKILLIAGGADEVFPARKLLDMGPDSGLAMLQIPGLTHWIKYGSMKRWRAWKRLLVNLMETFRDIEKS